MRLFKAGVSSRGIAALLGVSRHTVVCRTRDLQRPSRWAGLDVSSAAAHGPPHTVKRLRQT